MKSSISISPEFSKSNRFAKVGVYDIWLVSKYQATNLLGILLNQCNLILRIVSTLKELNQL